MGIPLRKTRAPARPALTHTSSSHDVQGSYWSRFFWPLLSCAVALYLTIAFTSDWISWILGRDIVPGSVEANLSGRVGAVLAYGFHRLLGVLHLAVPAMAVLLAVWVVKKRSAWQNARDLSILTIEVTLAATFLSAISLAGTQEAQGGWGGRLGDSFYRTLHDPFGEVGGILIPLVSGLALSALLIDYRLLLKAGAAAVQTAIRVGAPMLRAAVEFLAMFGRRMVRLVTHSRETRKKLEEMWKQARTPAVTDETPLPWQAAALQDDLEEEIEYEEEVVDLDAPMPTFLRPTIPPRIETKPLETIPTPKPSLPLVASKEEARPAVPRPTTIASAASDWVVPLDLFLEPEPNLNSDADQAELDRLGETLIQTLRTFKIEATMTGRTVGPTVVCFQIIPAEGTKVSSIESREQELAMSLRTERVRVTLLPRSGAIGIEMARPNRRLVRFRELLEMQEFQTTKAALPVALGLNLAGKPVVADLAKMPHLLVAGATGTGKSVGLNTILTSLLSKHPPEELRMILVDPKRVELTPYKNIPHLRHPVLYEGEEATQALAWAVMEMERRYQILTEVGVRNLFEYERKRQRWTPDPDLSEEENTEPEKLPFLVICIDELADLVMTSGGEGGELMRNLVLIAQKARAVGIYLILATQRPTVQVITGNLKANIPTRIAFRVAQRNDSRTILDQNGADQLLGNGDMLFLMNGATETTRLQGAYLDDEEIERFTRWCEEQRKEWEKPEEENILDAVRANNGGANVGEGTGSDERDELFNDALEICIEAGGGSTSLLQRKLRIGYGKAARIIDQLVDAGYLGHSDGNRPRPLLI